VLDASENANERYEGKGVEAAGGKRNDQLNPE
jgi:hypothetical protein